jgi:ketosteroid isomerase-like protein
MKQLIVLALISLSLFACTSSAEKKEKANLAIAKKYMQAVETKDVALMDSLLADNYIGYGPSIGDSTNKEEALLSWEYNTENLYESIEYTHHQELAVTVKEGRAKGDWVLNWAYLTIKYKDGRGPVNTWLNVVYVIENGEIIMSRTFYNEADVLRQLNYSINPPQEFFE